MAGRPAGKTAFTMSNKVQTTQAERAEAPMAVKGRANRGAWAKGFRAGVDGGKPTVPYAMCTNTQSLRRSWLAGWETGAKSRVERKAVKPS